MAISDTEHLSQLPIEEIKTVHKLWPNPATTMAIIPIVVIGASATSIFGAENKSQMVLILEAAGVLAVISIVFIYTFIKLGKAKKQLKAYAEARSLPPKKVLKEFKKQYPKMARELK